jgi:hypothetical protein
VSLRDANRAEFWVTSPRKNALRPANSGREVDLTAVEPCHLSRPSHHVTYLTNLTTALSHLPHARALAQPLKLLRQQNRDSAAVLISVSSLAPPFPLSTNRPAMPTATTACQARELGVQYRRGFDVEGSLNLLGAHRSGQTCWGPARVAIDQSIVSSPSSPPDIRCAVSRHATRPQSHCNLLSPGADIPRATSGQGADY